MVKMLLSVVLIGLITFPGGCATLNSLTAPGALQSGAVVIACDVAMSSMIALRVEDAIKSKQAVIDTTGNVYTVSSTVCAILGGRVKGMTLLP